jgi:class 3 adenylate cyclase
MVKTSELRDDGGGEAFDEEEFEQDLNAAGGLMGSHMLSKSLNKSAIGMGTPQVTAAFALDNNHHDATADDEGGGDDTSMLTEISDLLDAYTKMRNAIRSFTRYVPRDVVRELLMANTLCRIAMDSKRCAMLFEDIANFTTICEKVPPPALSRAVRVYFERMSRLVALHGGIVDKFIGDCVMAVWGAPCDVSHPEVRAALCALAFHRAAISDPLARIFKALDTVLAVRVGVAGGDVLAGNMGSPDRMSYTVIGDAVNLAARLESFNKQWGTCVLLSDDVAEEARSILVCRAIITASVVGRATPVTVYDVAGVSPAAEAAAAQMQDGNDFSSHSAGIESANTDDLDLGARMPVADVGQRLRFMKLVSYHARRNPATAADIGFAARFTEAVTALRGCQFAECAEALRNEIVQGLIPASAAYDCRKSVEAVLTLAERLASSPPTSDDLVDGSYVYRADHK